MSEARNTQMVKDAYAAFLRGDAQTILDMLDDHVEWQGVIGGEGVLPNAGRRKGKAQVAEFFGQVAEAYDFERFDPKEFVAQGDTVVAVGDYRAVTKPANRIVNSEWAMVFTFRDGKIASFREFTDSAQLVKAYAGA